MKTTFTILFFTGNLLLIVFSILFLKMIDARAGAMILFGAGSGILIVIMGLIVLLNRYLKAPTQDSKN